MQDAVLGETNLRWEKGSIIGRGLEEYTARIDVKMLLNNSIPGVLPLQIRYIDNDSLYHYCVSGWIPFEQLLQENALDFSIIQRLYFDIYQACCSCEEYFLRAEHFVLDAAYIAWNPGNKRSSVCYFPGYQMAVSEQMKGLSERLLTKINHQDKRCVAFLYGIYDLIIREGYSLPQTGEYLKQYQQQEDVRLENEAENGKLVCKEKPKEITEWTNQEKERRRKKELSTHKDPQMLSSYSLRIISKKILAPEVISLGQETLLIGRSPENQCIIPAGQISRRHAKIEQEGGQVYLTDMNAANGVFLNGKRLPKKHPVLCKEGDKISFADITYRLEHQGGALLKG